MPFWTPNPVPHTDGVFSFEVIAAACVGPPGREFLMGGVAMAAAIDALERTSERPLQWATIQFLAAGRLGEEVSITTEQRGGGRRITQAGASLTATGRNIQTVSTALGEPSSQRNVQFATMPKTLPPEDCSIKNDDVLAQSGNLMAQFERRTAFEDPETGVEHMWIRPLFNAEIGAPLLALTSDFLLGAHPRTRGGTSLDNTVRIFSRQPTEWILSATRLAGIGQGVAHGVQHQFAEDGTLLTVSSQTGLLPRHEVDRARD